MDPDESPFNRASFLLRRASLSACCRQKDEAPPQRASPFRLECQMHGHCHPDTHVTSRIPSVRSASHFSDSGIILTFAARILIASPCSVTTAASDDEFSKPTNTPGWNRGSHFPPLAGLVSMCKIFSSNSKIGVLSLRTCSLCSSVSHSLPMSHLFVRYAANSTSPAQYLCGRAGLWSQCESHRTFYGSIGLAFTPTGGLSRTVSLPSWRAC